MIQVNERSTAVLSMTFTDESKTAVTPTSARYCIVDELSGTILTDWTAFTPSSSTHNLLLDQSNNQIIDSERDIETRIITVVFEYNSGTRQCSSEFRYEVKNLVSAPPGVILSCSGGAVIGGNCVFTTT